jgi:hypothetical protein
VTRAELIQLDRETLLVRAEQLGVPSARTLTRPELVDEILLRAAEDPQSVRLARGFFGLARDLLARVVQRGLHLPDAVERVRGVAPPPPPRQAGPAIPTMTLADIYASQGHVGRAVATLHALLELDPNNEAARGRLATLNASSGDGGAGPADANVAVTPPATEPPRPPLVEGTEDPESLMPTKDVSGAPAHDAVDDDDLPRPLDAEALAEHLRSSGAALALQLRNPRTAPALSSHADTQAQATTPDRPPTFGSVANQAAAVDSGLTPTSAAPVVGDGAHSAARANDEGADAAHVRDNVHCQSLQLSPGVWHLSWSIDEHVASEQASLADWRLVVLTVLPGWSGSEVRQLVHPLASACGFLVLREVERNAVMRILLGRQTPHGIRVVAIGRSDDATAVSAPPSAERAQLVTNNSVEDYFADSRRRARNEEFGDRVIDVKRA